MIWVWADASRRGLRQLKEIEKAWDESVQDLTPDLVDPDGTVRKVDPTSGEGSSGKRGPGSVGGREPSEKLRARHVSQKVSRRAEDCSMCSSRQMPRNWTRSPLGRRAVPVNVRVLTSLIDLQRFWCSSIRKLTWKVAFRDRCTTNYRVTRELPDGSFAVDAASDLVDQDQAIATLKFHNVRRSARAGFAEARKGAGHLRP